MATSARNTVTSRTTVRPTMAEGTITHRRVATTIAVTAVTTKSEWYQGAVAQTDNTTLHLAPFLQDCLRTANAVNTGESSGLEDKMLRRPAAAGALPI